MCMNFNMNLDFFTFMLHIISRMAAANIRANT